MLKNLFMLLCLMVSVSSAHSLEYWNQNSTYFVRLSLEETQKLSWCNTLPSKNNTDLIVSGTYFNPYNNKPVALIKRWKDIHFDQPTYIPPRPLLFLPLNNTPKITYDRTNLGRWSIGGGPMLVRNSIIHISTAEEKFKSDVKKSRVFMAVGMTTNKELIFIATFNRSMKDIAWCFKFLKCTEAMRFDGGSSTYIYVKGEKEIGNRGRCSNYLFLLPK